MLVYLCWIISTENLLVFLNRCIVSHFHSFDIVLWSNKFSICVGLIITVNYILFWIIVHCMRSIRIRISNHLQFIPLHLQQFCHWRVEHLNFNNHFFNWTPKSVARFIFWRLEVNALLCLRTNFNYLVLMNMDKCLNPQTVSTSCRRLSLRTKLPSRYLNPKLLMMNHWESQLQ